MASFYDDFERANGELGADWTELVSSFNIYGGYVRADSLQSVAIADTISDSGQQYAKITAAYVDSNSLYAMVGVKIPNDAGNGYWAWVRLNGSDYEIVVGKGYAGNPTVLDSTVIGTTQPYTWTLEIEYADGHVTATYNGSVVAEADDNTYAGNEYAGIAGYGTNTRIGAFWCSMGAAPTLTVTPNPVGNFGDPVVMSAAGTNTSWTSGTPGSPTFTVNHGTITAQQVTSTTAATLTYDPGNFLGTAIFTDPSTGATCAVVVSSDTAYLPNYPGQFTQEAVDYIERSAVAETNPTIANRDMVISESGPAITLQYGVNSIRLSTRDVTYNPGGEPGATYLLAILHEILNQAAAPPANDSIWDAVNTARQYLFDHDDEWNALRGTGGLTLQGVIDALHGTPGGTHQDILTAIEGVSEPDFTAVLNAIAALRGNEIATVATVENDVIALRTVNDWTLGSVKTWIDALPQDLVDLAPVLTAISNLSTQLTNVETGINNNIAGLGIVLSALEVLMGVAGGGVTTVMGGLVDIIDLINELPPPVVPPQAPVWPGLANVTLGSSTPLSDGLELAGPMHGLLLTVTGTPPNAGRYLFGAVKSYTHVGAVMFKADNDHWERPESIGIEAHILAPKGLESADAAILRVNPGFTGTVRTWVRT